MKQRSSVISSVFFAFALAACNERAEVSAQTELGETSAQAVFENMEKLGEGSVFFTICVYDKGKISVGIASALDTHLLVAPAHLFSECVQFTNHQILIRTSKKTSIAELLFLNFEKDIAFLKTDFNATPLTLRSVESEDLEVYIVGYWAFLLEDTVLSHAFAHKGQLIRQLEGSTVNPDYLAFVGVSARGFSGSPLIAADGHVIGFLATIFLNNEDEILATHGTALKAEIVIDALETLNRSIK